MYDRNICKGFSDVFSRPVLLHAKHGCSIDTTANVCILIRAVEMRRDDESRWPQNYYSAFLSVHYGVQYTMVGKFCLYGTTDMIVDIFLDGFA